MINIQIEMAIASVILFLIIAIALKKNSISTKSSVAWLLLPVVFLFMAIFPEPLSAISNWLGFEAPANFVFLITIALLIVLCFFLTVTVSHQQVQITKLIQELSILKKEQSERKKQK